ncbi:hypothetical protein AB0F18_33885 [Streptomyces sp. NPDC029216]|uniref:hypothetical protein n=1 Tax=Streptomyces sp. NPDC029216 TaxID=3154701 RepID=UPI0033D8EBA7
MALVTVLILVAVLTFVALLALAPSAPARHNPFPGRRRPDTGHRAGVRSPKGLPRQRGFRHQAR